MQTQIDPYAPPSQAASKAFMWYKKLLWGFGKTRK